MSHRLKLSQIKTPILQTLIRKCDMFISPATKSAGWDQMTRIRRRSISKSRLINPRHVLAATGADRATFDADRRGAKLEQMSRVTAGESILHADVLSFVHGGGARSGGAVRYAVGPAAYCFL
jgi:hypothetical protein